MIQNKHPIYTFMPDCNQKVPLGPSAYRPSRWLLSMLLILNFILDACAVPPFFTTSLTDCKTGRLVFTLTAPSTSGGYDTNTMNFVFPESFLSMPTIGLGYSFINSLYPTSTSLATYSIDLSVAGTSMTGGALLFNRTQAAVTQLAVNYIAVTSFFFLEITTSRLDLENTTLFTSTAATERSIARSIGYRNKSNSTNAIIVLSTVGMLSMKQNTSTFKYTLSISAKFATSYEVTVLVGASNRLQYVTVYGFCYQTVATTIFPPFYLSIGAVTDFAGTIPQLSGAIGTTSAGTIFTSVWDWTITDQTGINYYDFALTYNTFILTSQSLQFSTNSYIWYRQQSCSLYYYLTNNDCVACHISCATCSGTMETQCLTCPSTRQYNSINRTCTCLTGYVNQGGRECIEVTCDNNLCQRCADINKCASCYGISQRQLIGFDCVCKPYRLDVYAIAPDYDPFCKSCHYSCYRCMGTAATDCSACNSTVNRREYKSNNNTCTCMSKFYDSGVVNCASCQYTCSTCTSILFCTTCNTTLGRIWDNTSTFCACRAGMYDNLLIEQCQTCMYECATCNSSLICLSCPSTRYLVNRSAIQVRCMCLNGYYDDGISKQCLACNYTCYTCLNPNTCQSCSSLAFREFNFNTSLCQCISGYYDNLVTTICPHCHVTCLTCTSGLANTCTSCNTIVSYRYLTVNSTCTCMDRYYEVNSSVAICARCHYTCSRCVNALACVDCDATRFRVAGNSSYCVCQPGYYDTGNEICTKCPSKCLTCTDLGICLTCDAATRLTAPNCLCKDGFYDDSINTFCQPCLPECRTCVNPFQCTGCPLLTHVLTATGQCRCANKYLSPGCTPCALSCRECSGTADNCVQCSAAAYRYYRLSNVTGKGQCLCSDGYFSDNVNQLCSACHFSCATCSSSLSCSSCPPSRQFDSNNRYCQCNSQLYQNSTTLSCLLCHYSCASCLNLTVCLTCDVTKHRITDTAGVSSLCVCDVGYYDDGSRELCLACAVECRTCSTVNNCTSCDVSRFRVLNALGTGRCECSLRYYESIADYLCYACSYSCQTCLNGVSCLTCISGRVLDPITGLCRCSDGYFQNSTTLQCVLCAHPCSKCSTTPTTCAACLATYVLLPSANTCYCPTSTFDNGTACQNCLPTCLICVNQTQCQSCRPGNNRVLAGTAPQLCACLTGFHDENSTILTCRLCHYSCATCSNSLSCNTCADIRTLINGTNSYCSCPALRFFDDGSSPACRPCSYLCASCSVTASNCTSCTVAAFRTLFTTEPSTGTSTCICSPKYYNDATATNQVCQPCHYSCNTCADSTGCLTCNTTQFRLYVVNVSSYCLCRGGYYDVTGNPQCQKCDYTCKTCMSIGSYCLTCDLSRNLTANACPCRNGLYDDVLVMNPVCQACMYLCETCANASTCLTCPITRALNSSLMCACLPGYYDDSTSKQCQACHPTCQECSDYQQCTSCHSLTQLRVLSLRRCICPQGLYDGLLVNPVSLPLNYTCQPCHYSCQRCQNALLCSSCNVLMSRIRNVTTGLCACVSGYYDDMQSQGCQVCSFDCLTCSGPTTCLSCPGSRTLNNTTARCECSSLYYTNGTLCELCPPECSTCTSLSACTACRNPTLRVLVNGTCLCVPSYYPVPSSQLCQLCHYSCQTCSSSPFCLTCAATTFRFLSNRQCRCLGTYYDDAPNPICQRCHYSCLTCSNFTGCQTCDTTYTVNRILDPLTGYCACTSGYYQDPTTKVCLSCHYSCLTCSDGSTCTSCSPISNRNLTNGRCTCPSIGYYDQPGESLCIACDPTCHACANTPTYCTDCNTNVTYRTLTPTHTCQCAGLYFQSGINTVICSACSYKCLTCSSAQSECTSCSASNSRNASTLPRCDCMTGYYDDGSSPACALCDYRCYQCTSSASRCTACNTPATHRLLNPINSICQCPVRYYQPLSAPTALDPLCRPCHHSCLTCMHDTLCLTCDTTNNTRTFNNGRCLCVTGYYDDGSSLLCLKCDYRCRTCANAGSCSSCTAVQNRRYSNVTTLCECLRGYYDKGDGIDPRCYACHASCYECTNDTSCSTCQPLSNRYINASEGTGYCICLYGYYQLTLNGRCERCHYTCQKCAITNTSCALCDASAHRVLSSGRCLCQPGYYDDGANEPCLLCASNCVSCFGVNEGQCLVCRNGSYLLNGVCMGACPGFYYPIDTNWTCGACLSYCQQCTNSSTCIRCQNNTYLLSTTLSTYICTFTCPQFYYNTSTTCLACLAPCLHCTQPYTCLDCVPGYYLDHSLSACYPCYSTCRFCLNSTVIGCLSCIDGYYLNTTTGLCTKLTCLYNQYVNSAYGCYQCSATYPNSATCTNTRPLTCLAGYILSTNPLTASPQCLRCDRLPGYSLVPSTGTCKQICGDGIRYADGCDDGNVLNGDGCNAWCGVEQGWECRPEAGGSECRLVAGLEMVALSVRKLQGQNKIEVVLGVNVGVRLGKGNFLVAFDRGQNYAYEVAALNSRYTSYQLTIEYFQNVVRSNLTIRVLSPIGPVSTRLLTDSTLTVPLTITLNLQLQLQLLLTPLPIYTDNQTRLAYTRTLQYIFIALNVLTLMLPVLVLLLARLKLMLYTAELWAFKTFLYMYGTYGLYEVMENVSQAGRGLQHYIYAFGQGIEGGAAGWFGFGGLVLAGVLVQVALMLTVFIGGVWQAMRTHTREQQKQNPYRYYMYGLAFTFTPEILLSCAIIFKHVPLDLSLQSAYSWAIALVLVVVVLATNINYCHHCYGVYRSNKIRDRDDEGRRGLPFVTLQNRESVVSEKRMGHIEAGTEREEGQEVKRVMQDYDPFDEQEEQQGEKQEKSSQVHYPRHSIINQRRQYTDDNKTEAVLMPNPSDSASSHSNSHSVHHQAATPSLYDLSPQPTLHPSHLPALALVCCVLPVVLLAPTALLRSILLVCLQLASILHLLVTAPCALRTAKLIVMALVLMLVGCCGLAGSIIVDGVNGSARTEEEIEAAAWQLWVLEGVVAGAMLLGLLFSLVMFVVQVGKSEEWKMYMVRRRNQEILERNQRRNRLKGIKYGDVVGDRMEVNDTTLKQMKESDQRGQPQELEEMDGQSKSTKKERQVKDKGLKSIDKELYLHNGEPMDQFSNLEATRVNDYKKQKKLRPDKMASPGNNSLSLMERLKQEMRSEKMQDETIMMMYEDIEKERNRKNEQVENTLISSDNYDNSEEKYELKPKQYKKASRLSRKQEESGNQPNIGKESPTKNIDESIVDSDSEPQENYEPQGINSLFGASLRKEQKQEAGRNNNYYEYKIRKGGSKAKDNPSKPKKPTAQPSKKSKEKKPSKQKKQGRPAQLQVKEVQRQGEGRPGKSAKHRRIDSISSINEQDDYREADRVKADTGVNRDEEGVSVYKKILEQYQIYKNRQNRQSRR